MLPTYSGAHSDQRWSHIKAVLLHTPTYTASLSKQYRYPPTHRRNSFSEFFELAVALKCGTCTLACTFELLCTFALDADACILSYFSNISLLAVALNGGMCSLKLGMMC